MPISIENDRPDATGAAGIEGIFGNQIEQRIGHHIDREDDDIIHLHPQGDNLNKKDSPPVSPLPLSSYKPRRSRFNPLSWFSSSSKQGYSSLGGLGARRSSRRWWHYYPRQLHRGASAVGSSTRLGRSVQAQVASVVTFVASSKRRKSWFLSLILVSLVFTVLSAGYMLSQFHQHELAPPVEPSTIIDENNPSSPIDLPLAPEGPRRNRDRGKKRPKKNKPVPKTQEEELEVGARPNTPSKDEQKGKPDQVDKPLDASKGNGGANGGQKEIPMENETPKLLDKEDGLRICDLEDITHGEWVSIDGGVPRGLNVAAKDLSWSGYGYAGCRSHIWNERYLLTPTSLTSSGTVAGSQWTRATTAKQDLEYALRAKHLQWRAKGRATANKKEACRQPEMDIPDFVEILKRSPLVMVGDKFLELEYLTLECMILGMQRTLSGSEEQEYQIETEMPPVTELRLGPGNTEGVPRIYRKAKPGKMQLVDRASNLTLVTFIRSDVLWSADVHPDLADMALHPDCKLVGTALLCEPALVRDERGVGSPLPTTSNNGSWWKWWSGNPSSTTETETREQYQDLDELAIGSDLDQDMINLEWASILKQTVEQERSNKVPSEDTQKGGEDERSLPRKPTVVISNGLLWKYDPRETSADAILDSIASSQGGADRAAALKASRASRRSRRLTKAELEQIKAYQDMRRKQLKQRYVTLLASTLEYIHTSWPELRVIVQTSVKHRPCEALVMVENVGELSVQERTEQEAAVLNALTKTVVARVQDPLYSFLDTSFLRLYRDASPNMRQCRTFMMPGPLDTLVEQLYGELFRLDI